MWSRRSLGWVLGMVALAVPALASEHLHGGHHHSGGTGRGGTPGFPLGAVGSVPFYYPPYYETIGANGLPIVYVPPQIVPVMILPVATTPIGPAPGLQGMGVAGPWRPPRRRGFPVAAPQRAIKADPGKASQLTTVGDRLFRAGNYKRAAERYEQAARLDPHSAAPRVRLAQIALVRGQFSEAANQFREAQTAEPTWLIKANDIQSIYSEPSDFAKQIAKLESHLQAEPNDRDAWLVLGAQWYLSGRTRKAADVFLRLADRKPDSTLSAFLDATRVDDRDRQ